MLVADEGQRATDYLHSIEKRPFYPYQRTLNVLVPFEQLLPDRGRPGAETLALLEHASTPLACAHSKRPASMLPWMNGRAAKLAT